MMKRLRRWLRGAPAETPTPPWVQQPASPAPQPELAYAVQWLETIRDWSPDQRRAIGQAVQTVVAAPDFAPTSTRRYVVDGLESRVSGASLAALAQALAAWEAQAG